MFHTNAKMFIYILMEEKVQCVVLVWFVLLMNLCTVCAVVCACERECVWEREREDGMIPYCMLTVCDLHVDRRKHALWCCPVLFNHMEEKETVTFSCIILFTVSKQLSACVSTRMHRTCTCTDPKRIPSFAALFFRENKLRFDKPTWFRSMPTNEFQELNFLQILNFQCSKPPGPPEQIKWLLSFHLENLKTVHVSVSVSVWCCGYYVKWRRDIIFKYIKYL